MVDNEELKEKVREALKEVSRYSIGKVEMILRQESDVGDEVLKEWKRVTLDVCYDREYCEELGVDYNNLPKDGVKRIEVFALLLIRDYPKIVLPVL